MCWRQQMINYRKAPFVWPWAKKMLYDTALTCITLRFQRKPTIPFVTNEQNVCPRRSTIFFYLCHYTRTSSNQLHTRSQRQIVIGELWRRMILYTWQNSTFYIKRTDFNTFDLIFSVAPELNWNNYPRHIKPAISRNCDPQQMELHLRPSRTAHIDCLKFILHKYFSRFKAKRLVVQNVSVCVFKHPHMSQSHHRSPYTRIVNAEPRNYPDLNPINPSKVYTDSHSAHSINCAAKHIRKSQSRHLWLLTLSATPKT